MKETILRSGINRRTLLTTLALLPALSAPPLSVFASAQTASSGPLPSWNEGSAKQAILDFVRDTTDPANPKFVPPEERIATFDQDGLSELSVFSNLALSHIRSKRIAGFRQRVSHFFGHRHSPILSRPGRHHRIIAAAAALEQAR